MEGDGNWANWRLLCPQRTRDRKTEREERRALHPHTLPEYREIRQRHRLKGLVAVPRVLFATAPSGKGDPVSHRPNEISGFANQWTIEASSFQEVLRHPKNTKMQGGDRNLTNSLNITFCFDHETAPVIGQLLTTI